MKNEVLQVHSFYQYSDVDISFSIKTKMLDLQTMSDFLKLKPTRGFTNREKYIGKQLNTDTKEVETIEREKPYTLFVYETKGLVNSKEFQDHAVHLLNKLDAIKDNLKDFLAQPDKFEILIRVDLKIDKEEVYFGFTPELTTLKRLTDYCHIIEWNGKLQ